MKKLFLAASLLSTAAVASGPDVSPKPASRATVAAQEKIKASLPTDDGSDEKFADQGFIATLPDPIIRDSAGKPVWNLGAYKWMQGNAPATVNPSLWRHQKLLSRNGLYKLSDDMWQVRGFDISNMTVIKGQTGWILIDPLTSRDSAAAALALVNANLGQRPVTGVIYTHSHGDHFGGVRGVTSLEDIKAGKVQIIAPAHFIEETSSENVMAGAAMGRRANYQFGANLSDGPQGRIGSGIGSSIAGGDMTLLPPTDTISKTGETRIVDGVALEFQMVPESEAPAEMNVMVPTAKTLLIGEIATCSLHNILTPRGAKVRNTHKWASYLTEAINLYADRIETFGASHCWPRFGKDVVRSYLTLQRDNYKYLHDQSVRLMNKGETQAEIAESLRQPPAIAAQWSNHGYYGTYSHNSKAIYQYYIGWYDGNPANLNLHPPVERARKAVAAMGGAAKALAVAKKAMDDGDYRWSSDLLNQILFADATNTEARSLLADSLEQQGYQAESAIWRNQFLSAARDLREGVKPSNSTQGRDMIAAIPTGLLLDSVATRLDPAVIGAKSLSLNLVFSDRSETARLSVSNAVMVTEMGKSHPTPAATLTGPRMLFLGLLFQKAPLSQMEAAGLKVEGDRAALEALLSAIEPVPANFNIVEP